MDTDTSQIQPEDISVLVVDDDYATIEVIHELLKRSGFQITTVTNGDEANRLLLSREFHVLVADLCMSPVSGWDVIRHAKEVGDTEIIVLTGYVSLDSSLEALHHRVFDFLQKPMDFQRLERAIRNAALQNMLAKHNRRLTQELSRKNQQLEEEVRKVRNELENLIIHDDLTGLYNYRYLQSLLAKELPRALRYGQSLSLAMLDLDYFKELNDFHGHTFGNEALTRVAGILKDEARQSDFPCRYGGEEFAIVLPVTSKHQAEPMIRRLCASIRKARIPVNRETFLTCSGGLATVPDDAATVDELLRLADNALYRAKQLGRDKVVLA